MRPSNKTWSLTVRAGSLHLDAPHGSFEVKGIAPEVMPVVEALPDGTDLECDGAFDGGGTITHLVVTRVRRILKDLSGRVMKLPDVVVAADPRLSLARAQKHFAAGDIAKAAVDVASLLQHGDELALAEYERLPREQQQALFEALVAWQAQNPLAWRALKHIPLARWTDAQLERAAEQALGTGGVFGAAPGVRMEELVAELDRRKLPTKQFAKQTQRLRRAQATEGDTVHRLLHDLEWAHVIGGDTTSVFVHGAVTVGKSVVQKGAMRQSSEDRENVVVHYALDGRELRRWRGLAADAVVSGVALQIEVGDPPGRGVRLSDGAELFKFAHRIEHVDGEVVWGIHARDAEKRRMRSEIRHIATGFTIAKLDGWVDDVEWNAQHVFVRGAAPQTLTREGRVVASSVPVRPTTISIEAATATHTIPAEHAPWLFQEYRSVESAGWIAHYRSRELYLASSELGATWVHLQLARGDSIELAPPWLAVHDEGSPIVLVALAEAMSAQRILVDGKTLVKRAKDIPKVEVPEPLHAWYDVLVERGLLVKGTDAARDALLYRAMNGWTQPPDDVTARILVGGNSPVAIEHHDYDIEAGDNVFSRISALFADDDFAIEEIARKELDLPDDDDEEREEIKLTLRARRDGKTLKRQCGASVGAVFATVDKLAEELGTKRRIFRVEADDDHVFVVITKQQRRALVEAGITGIRASAK